MSLSPILTVSTSLFLESKILILGGGASGADVMLIISGSLQMNNTNMSILLSGRDPRRVLQTADNLPNWHHSERDILRGHVVGALNFVYFVGFSHDDAMMLQDDRVGVDTGLTRKSYYYVSNLSRLIE